MVVIVLFCRMKSIIWLRMREWTSMIQTWLTIESKSLAVTASTLDSLLELLCGIILWFTSNAMRNPNQYCMMHIYALQGIIVFASVMATLGFQILLESTRQFIAKTCPDMNRDNECWVLYFQGRQGHSDQCQFILAQVKEYYCYKSLHPPHRAGTLNSVEKENIELYFVNTEFQLADLFTKALDEKRFKFLISRLGMIDRKI
ncbi:hypothetical protein OSB04_024976 [Centaurea solstitialis]|uniref:Uncharacterized protein n=1 Tax=Centaurea solstitialis TaxID=347529 RepID=A0AA38WCL7_9ASTR|nr:hypothetical protein OSB04_024976 [Centaurea solstitialis]